MHYCTLSLSDIWVTRQECRVGTPYMERNFIDSLPKAKVDQSESSFFAKKAFRICDRAKINSGGPFHNFFSPKMGRFWWALSLSEKSRQNLRMAGRRAFVLILLFHHYLHRFCQKLFCPPFWDSACFFQKGIFINVEWLRLLAVIFCTHQCTLQM